MARIDLNAKRAARSEAENQPHEVVLGFDASGAEQVFLLKPRMPLEYVSLLRTGDTVAAIKTILIDPSDWERMRQYAPEDDDLYDIGQLYDVDMGESRASSPSSNGSGQSSRPTSNGSTDSILPVPAGERALLESDASPS